jgi:hypothetical protein
VLPRITLSTFEKIPFGASHWGGRIPGLGKVRIVVSFKHESLMGRSVVIVTNRVDWSTAKIIRLP